MSSVTLPKVAGRPKRGGLQQRLLQRESTLGYALLVPTMVMLLVFLAWPFLFGIWLAMSNAEIGNDSAHFVGIENFIYNLSDTIFVQSFWNTMAYTAITTVFKFALGMSMALLLNQVFPLQRFARAALLLPWIIPSVLSTLAWRWMFDPTFSVLNWVLIHAFHSNGVNWLGTTNTALAAIFIVNIWRGAPFYGISLLAGLQTIPPDLYEAARVDGASRWQQFREITLPLLRPVLLVVLLLSTILTFADFQLPYVLTRGAPYNSTNVLATWAFNIGVPGGSIGIGAAISLVLFPLLAVAITAVLVSLRSKE
ncbi:MAG: sugar ABC transporter permease [Candidatus Dormibacteraeota bacterium]|nr:sugar ABC transporter permease [Candidatus Dormibacteraeota bacterium]